MKFPSRRRLLFLAIGAIVLSVVAAFGSIVVHLERQRWLQNEFGALTGERSGAWLHAHEEHWLKQYVTSPFDKRLPGQRIQLILNKPEQHLPSAVRIGAQIADVSIVSITDCHDVAQAWKLVSAHPQLQRLQVTQTEVGDGQIAELTEFARLETLIVNDAPLTDIALGTIAELPALRELQLHGTNVTHAAIVRFSETRPDVAVGWTPCLSPAQRATQAALELRGNTVVPINDEGYRVEKTIVWSAAIVRRAEMSDATLLRDLQEPIKQLFLGDGWEDDALRALSELPGLKEVDFGSTAATRSAVEAMCEVESIEHVAARLELLRPEESAELQERWPKKLVNRR